MKTLTESDVLRIMREEWDKKIAQLSETIDVVMTAKVGKGKKETVISPELKVLHKKSGIRYTVDSVGPKDIILRTPEGETFLIDAKTLEDEYELDLRKNDNDHKDNEQRPSRTRSRWDRQGQPTQRSDDDWPQDTSRRELCGGAKALQAGQ